MVTLKALRRHVSAAEARIRPITRAHVVRGIRLAVEAESDGELRQVDSRQAAVGADCARLMRHLARGAGCAAVDAIHHVEAAHAQALVYFGGTQRGSECVCKRARLAFDVAHDRLEVADTALLTEARTALVVCDETKAYAAGRGRAGRWRRRGR